MRRDRNERAERAKAQDRSVSCGDRNSFCVTKEKYFVYHVEKTNTS